MSNANHGTDAGAQARAAETEEEGHEEGTGNGASEEGGGGEISSPSSYFMEGYTPLSFNMNALALGGGGGEDDDDWSGDGGGGMGVGGIANAADEEEMDGQLFASGYYHMMGAPPKRLNGVKDNVLGLAMHPGYEHEGASNDTSDSGSDRENAHNDDDEGTTPTETIDVPDDFHRLAEQALRGLDVEHTSTLERSLTTPMDAVATPNIDAIAVAPAEEKAPSTSADFEATFPNFDDKYGAPIPMSENHKLTAPDSAASEMSAATPSKKTIALPKIQLKEPKPQPMDIDAVQKAMQSIRLKSPQLATTLDAGASSSFSAKTAHVATDAAMNAIVGATSHAIEQSRKQQLATHAIIPAGPLAAFRRSTPKAQAASANLTRSATLSEAVLRLWPLICFRRRARAMGLGGQAAQQSSDSSNALTIHILGADGVECSTEESVRQSVGPFVRWMDAALGSGALSRETAVINSLVIQFSGPNMPTARIGKALDLLPESKSQEEGSGLASARATFEQREYHEDPSTADIAIAFNAGIWGYDSWKTTLAHMCAPLVNDEERKSSADNALPTEGTLFIITAYTVEECEDDAEVIDEVVEKVASERFSSSKQAAHPIARQFWAPESNPFSSRLERPTASAPPERKYHENGAWQAWLLGL